MRRGGRAPARRARRRRFAVLMVACALALLFCLAMAYRETRDWRAGGDAYGATAARAVTLLTAAPAAPAVTAGGETMQQAGAPAICTPELPPVAVDFSRLTAADGTVAGWLYGEDTPLNYPVMAGTDNDYYLTHLPDGTKNACGTLFVDCANAGDFSGRNTVIHGHHMKNGSMFGWLDRYRDQAYFDAHARLYLLTPDAAYRLDLVAGYTTAAGGEGYATAFQDEEAFLAFVAAARARSDFVSPVEVQPGDRLVTLSTCAYEFEHARYVVHARLTPLS